VDVLAVMDYAAQTFRRLNAASPEDHRLDIEDAEQARAAVAELASASKALSLATEYGMGVEKARDRVRAAIAKFGGQS